MDSNSRKKTETEANENTKKFVNLHFKKDNGIRKYKIINFKII